MENRNDLTYEEFLQETEKQILDFCPAQYQERTVKIVQDYETGRKRDGLVLGEESRDVQPILYLHGYYTKMCSQHVPFPEVLSRIAADFQAEEQALPSLDLAPDLIWEQLTARVINAEENKRFLLEVPHRRLHDLAIYTVIKTSADAYICVTHDFCKGKGIDGQAAITAALENMPKLERPVFQSLEGLIWEFLKEEASATAFPQNPLELYVLSNPEGMFGAAYIAEKKVLDQIANRLERDFYILPSSRHELLILPYENDLDPEALRQMVGEVNRTVLEPEDILSDNIYQYDAKKRRLDIYTGKPQEKQKWLGPPKEGGPITKKPDNRKKWRPCK